jgi:ketosteroid isomerase-like protein
VPFSKKEKAKSIGARWDLDGFAEVLADEVVFKAPGKRQAGRTARERRRAPHSSAVGSLPSRTRMSKSTPFTSSTTLPLRRARSPGRNAVFSRVQGDIPPTGRSVEVDYVQVLRFHDGKHVSFNLLFDRLSMLEQLGLALAPAEAG